MDGKWFYILKSISSDPFLSNFYIENPSDVLGQTCREVTVRREADNPPRTCRLAAESAMEDIADNQDIRHSCNYHPHCIMSGVCDCSYGKKQIGVAIPIHSGTTEKELSLQVGPTQTTLEIYFTWPSVLTDVNVQHKVWF